MTKEVWDIIEHWFPFSDYDGAWCDPEDVCGSECNPAEILKEYCSIEIESWVEENRKRPDPWAPKYMEARIVFRGETWTASATIEKDADIHIRKAE